MRWSQAVLSHSCRSSSASDRRRYVVVLSVVAQRAKKRNECACDDPGADDDQPDGASLGAEVDDSPDGVDGCAVGEHVAGDSEEAGEQWRLVGAELGIARVRAGARTSWCGSGGAAVWRAGAEIRSGPVGGGSRRGYGWL